MTTFRSTSILKHLPGLRFLIINGDDFGLTDGVTQGILSAWKDGVLTSTTAMINIDGAPERMALAHRAHPTFPIGLHLNITQGRPVLPAEQVPSLVDRQGYFYPFLELIERLPRISFEEMKLECFAQAELLVRSGITFDHVDFHQGFPAAYEPFFPAVIELATHYQVPVRNPVPESDYGGICVQGSNSKAMAIREMARFTARHPRLAMTLLPHISPTAFKRSASKLRAAGIPTTNWLVDALYENARVETMISIIEQLPPGVIELACHPGLVDDDLRRSGYGYVEPRAAELAIMLNAQVKATLQRCQVRLVDFSFLFEE